MQSIAIVGMGCRFAGAPDLQSYWELTVAGRDSFGPVPPDRWDADAFFDTSRRATDRSYAPHGGFIDDVRSFPALHFGIPPRRVEVMDPQQRFALEMGAQAIADAGYRPADMPERTAVFIGVTASEYRQLMASRVTAQLMASGALGTPPEDPAPLAEAIRNVVPSRPFTAPGALANMIAAAVAQELDLHGPAYTVDAACASALIAVASACVQLHAGVIDAAVAGGVYVCVTPEHHIAFSRIGAMSASGYCRPFDARADGFVQGDGAGAVVLKRLDDAVADGDRIYAVIHGVATNNDGRGDGPMAPVEAGQVSAVRQAWEAADVSAADLGYVETHGTGTEVGDATELRALRAAFGDAVSSVALGSSKANVGHTMSAAGIAGVIRAALAIHHGVIPPMAGFASAKDELRLEESPYFVPTTAEPWTAERRVAGVSSFGFGGTNAHAVLAAAPAQAPAPDRLELICMSGADEAALRAHAGRLADEIDARQLDVTSVARAWAVRPALSHRLALAAATAGELTDQLRAVAAGGWPAGAFLGEAPRDAPSVALLFPGQGAQRIGMMRNLRRRFGAVAAALDEAEQVLSDELERPLTQLLYPELRADPVPDTDAAAELTYTANCQPAMVACGLALQRLLSEVGVPASIATGHSLGELNALVHGGALTPEGALRFAARRGAAMAAVQGDPGTMLALMTGPEQAEALLVDGAVLANHNHPRQVVVSGTTDAVAAVRARAEASGVEARPLDVSHAFHSPIFADLDMAPVLDAMELSDPVGTVISCISDEPYASAAGVADVLGRHARSAVHFERAVRLCVDAGAQVLLQVGAGGPLASFARKTAPDTTVLTLGSLDDDDGGRAVLQALGRLWTLGVPIDPRALAGRGPAASVPPLEPARQVYWAVKDRAQKRLELRAPSAAPPTEIAAAAPVAEAPAEAPSDPVLAKVVELVARVSSYPRDAVQPGLALVEDLGFDSLMVGDLATGLADGFPGLGGIPQELLMNRPTVGDIVDYVRGARGGSEGSDDDSPLLAYEVVWRAAPLEPLDERLDDRSICALPGVSSALAGALQALGARIVDAPADADLILLATELGTPPTPMDAAAAGWPDPGGALVEALGASARAGRRPDAVVVRRSDDPWAEGATAVVRCVAREWPDAAAKSLSVDPGAAPAEVAGWIRDEVLGADRTVDVRRTPAREVLGLAPASDAERAPLGAGDVVLVTGGTRGIGARLGLALGARGATVLLAGRGPLHADFTEAVAGLASVHAIRADVGDLDALRAAIAPFPPVTGVVHCAGVLADGGLGDVDAALGRTARSVKIDGWLNALAAAGPSLRLAAAIGSWAGRFGSRHQAHYAAGNAVVAALVDHLPPGVQGVVAEFGPWTDSEMVQTIPAAVRAAMRAEGVDFATDRAGQEALLGDLDGYCGAIVHGRDLPWTTRVLHRTEVLSADTHPYLADHALDGVPVFPLAAAADLLARVSALEPPLSLEDLRLFRGVPVSEPVELRAAIRGERAELRADGALAYRARVRPLLEAPADPGPLAGGAPSDLPLDRFYGGITFHGPLLQGLTAVDGVLDEGARGRVRVGKPAEWSPGDDRARFAIDPLVLDSAMQLSALVAYSRYRRAGTPVGLGRYVQLEAFPDGAELVVDAHFGAREDDRFAATFYLRDASGHLYAVAEEAVAELRRVEEEDAPLEIKREWIDPSTWPEVTDLQMRLDAAGAMGIRNPYFAVHQGTARNTTVVGDRELINYSSYNYLGLSGDPRVLADVRAAIDRYGTSVSASRVASGERPFHGELEAELAAAQGVEDALVFTAGHATNVTTIGHLLGPGDLVLHDELIHDSALQGIKLSGAGRRGFRHADLGHLDQLLRELRPHHEKVLIIIEGVYSMDGDICDLGGVLELKEQHGCLLMVDEAHSFGIVGATGCGLAEHWGIDGSRVDLWMGTLSKSLASCGGWIAGSRPLIQYLRYTAPGFIYSAGITPANGQAALSSLRLMLEEPWRVHELQANARTFHAALVARGIDTGPAAGESGVVPAVTGNSMHALMLSQRLADQGVNVQPIVYPAVADDAARLRFFLSSTHSTDELEHTAKLVADILAGVREEFRLA